MLLLDATIGCYDVMLLLDATIGCHYWILLLDDTMILLDKNKRR
jgi:hypothetical protein